MKNDSTMKTKWYDSLFFCVGSVVLILLVAFPENAAASRSWNQETTARELCFLFALSKDWQQTLDIAKHPDFYSESNRFLGPHPSESRVHMYFAGCALTHALLAYMLPPEYSKIWQVTWIGIQSNLTEHNTEHGLEQDMQMEYKITFSIPF